MPGGDGTGPVGLGAMTDRGLGICRGAANSGAGRGLGLGCRRGFGRGMEKYSKEEQTASNTQKEMLQEEKELLENRLELINKRIEGI